MGYLLLHLPRIHFDQKTLLEDKPNIYDKVQSSPQGNNFDYEDKIIIQPESQKMGYCV